MVGKGDENNIDESNIDESKEEEPIERGSRRSIL
jgi:hypothetical protein